MRVSPRATRRPRAPGGGSGRYGDGVRCPYCEHRDDRVVDSRTAESGSAIRRRRECRSCERRYTTYERIEEVPILVAKRSGVSEAYDRSKVVAGIRQAAAGRPALDEVRVESLADQVGELVREMGPEVSSEQVGIAVLDGLLEIDEVAYLRFASVYKGFEGVADFEREAQILQEKRLEKKTAPKDPADVVAGP